MTTDGGSPRRMNEPTPEPRFTIVEGRSDDLVLIKNLDRNRNEEVGRMNTSEKSPVRLRFSDATELDVFYDEVGIWRVKVIKKGLAFVRVDTLPADGEVSADNYTERAHFDSNIKRVELFVGHNWTRIA